MEKLRHTRHQIKTFLLLLLTLFFSILADAQSDNNTYEQTVASSQEVPITKTAITGFWGLSFGMTQSEVLSLIDYTVYQDDGDNVYLQDVTFGGNKYDNCLLSFYKGHLYLGSFDKLFDTSFQLIKDGKTVVESIKKKYGNYHYSENEEGSKNYFAWSDVNGNSIFVLLDTDTQKMTVMYAYDKIEQQKKTDESY